MLTPCSGNGDYGNGDYAVEPDTKNQNKSIFARYILILTSVCATALFALTVTTFSQHKHAQVQ